MKLLSSVITTHVREVYESTFSGKKYHIYYESQESEDEDGNGGGSSVMYIEDENGRVVNKNEPAHDQLNAEYKDMREAERQNTQQIYNK